VIEIDADDEPEGAVIIGEKASVDKNKKAVVHPIDWPKHSKVNFLVSCLCIVPCQPLTDSFLCNKSRVVCFMMLLALARAL
jgi:hypothetical protein